MPYKLISSKCPQAEGAGGGGGGAVELGSASNVLVPVLLQASCYSCSCSSLLPQPSQLSQDRLALQSPCRCCRGVGRECGRLWEGVVVLVLLEARTVWLGEGQLCWYDRVLGEE